MFGDFFPREDRDGEKTSPMTLWGEDWGGTPCLADSPIPTIILICWIIGLMFWVVMIHNSVMAFFYNILCMMSFCPRFSFYRNICVPKFFYIYFVTE
jgi:hypothetical protein